MNSANIQAVARPEPESLVRVPWLNRNVFGMGLTSLLSDAGHEMATTLLPGFLTVLGLPAAVLGAIEGIADAVSSFAKLGAGWWSDRIGHRKAICVGGYFLTGTSKALFALAHGWPIILLGRVLGWFGRGARGPLRDAMLAESVAAKDRGRAFGFHRAGDTVGAIFGPLLAVILLNFFHPHAADPSTPYRTIFLLTLIPGLGSVLAFALMVRETRRPPTRREFWESLQKLPKRFRRFLLAVGMFGLGDFSHSMMILAAAQLLTPKLGLARATQIAGLLYVLHNIVYAAVSYPVGALSDRWGRRRLLQLGFLLGVFTAMGLAAAFCWHFTSISFLALLFILGGCYVAFQDALEGALTADFIVELESRGTAYGLAGTVNGVGDLISSVLVGVLWTVWSPVAAFLYAGLGMGLGAADLYRVK